MWPESELDHLALHENIRASGGSCPRCRPRLRTCRCGGACRAGGPSAFACDCGGACPDCRRPAARFEAGAARLTANPPPRPAPRQTQAQTPGSQFGAWRGWSPPVTLRALLDQARRAREPLSPAARGATARIGQQSARGARPATRTRRRGRGQMPPQALAPFLRPGSNLYRITLPALGNPTYLSIGMTSSPRQTIARRIGQHYARRRDQRRSAGERALHRLLRAANPSQVLVQAGRLPANMPARLAHLYEIWLQHRERVSDWDTIRDTRTFETGDQEVEQVLEHLEAMV